MTMNPNPVFGGPCLAGLLFSRFPINNGTRSEVLKESSTLPYTKCSAQGSQAVLHFRLFQWLQILGISWNFLTNDTFFQRFSDGQRGRSCLATEVSASDRGPYVQARKS